MSLYTRKRIHSHIWEEMPIAEDVIEIVEQLAEIENIPYLQKINLFLSGVQVLKFVILSKMREK